MLALLIASLGFAAIHLLVAGTRVRDALVARLGEGAYSGLFSLASAGLLGAMIWTFVRARTIAITPYYDLRWVAVLLVFIAFVLIVLGVTTVGATGVGGGKQLQHPDSARGIHRITRHPFLWGVALWAAAHIAYNPGTAYLVFFGTFLVVALAGTFSIDAKRARRFGELWPAYARITSSVPFVAIAQGRNRLAPGEIGLWRIAAAIAVFVLALMLHARLFGMPAW